MIPKFNLHEEMVLHYVMINRFGNKTLEKWGKIKKRRPQENKKQEQSKNQENLRNGPIKIDHRFL
jgi:hypothetical protein